MDFRIVLTAWCLVNVQNLEWFGHWEALQVMLGVVTCAHVVSMAKIGCRYGTVHLSQKQTSPLCSSSNSMSVYKFSSNLHAGNMSKHDVIQKSALLAALSITFIYIARAMTFDFSHECGSDFCYRKPRITNFSAFEKGEDSLQCPCRNFTEILQKRIFRMPCYSDVNETLTLLRKCAVNPLPSCLESKTKRD